ncbi:enoyl-CoA hydratase-related protein [Natrialbaceae archaeon AArc-T1-2]|uniref:enoyl-CoA hydratase-related protein n=1 Tax=Natrialbaceae archaeon AArc-T1-2 TaxID=3053904 RepID=UPI00255B0A06|nr:enoyl-CoA hydratase-related protein [Natrialbaceae archaeon AArc-T1-2]WIV65965.1 enoyl-CoA hydratase-related protein [Natrialbaceae archaeon AArc-T1-2]
MTRETVDLEWTDDVATVTIDRPDRLNALNRETLSDLEDVLEETDEARAVVVTGAGDDAFVAGADIGYMQDLSTPEAQEYAELGHRVFDAITTHDAPVIAAVNGYAFGGGCELALASDLRIASENAVLGQTEIDLGIVPGWGGTQRLPRIASDSTARRMVFLGERLGAEEALEEGVVDDVVSQDELDEVVAEMAAEVAAKPTAAMTAAKEALNQAHETSQEAGLAFERRLWSGLFGTHDQREGMAAFVEDREPEFE